MSIWHFFRFPFRPSLPELFADSEEGFVDTALHIHRYSYTPEGSQVLHVRAASVTGPVGFALELLPEWRPDTLGHDIPVLWGAVRYRSLGLESTAFVRALARAYGTPIDGSMAPVISFAAVALKGNPADLKGGPVDMKLFFESEDEAHYAEVYTNIHLAQHVAEFREKDNGYRAPLLRALVTPAV